MIGKNSMKHHYLKKEDFFYNNLNIEDIIDADYNHTKGGEFGMKNLGEDNNLYIQRDKFLLSEVFRNFRNKFNKIYNLEPANFFSAPRLAWQAALKRQKYC